MFEECKPNPKSKKSAKKYRKALTKADKEHLLFIKSMRCCACGRSAPSEAHHITQCGRRLGHYYTIPLCHECHEGKFSIGNAKKQFIAKYGTELELLEKVKSKLLNHN